MTAVSRRGKLAVVVIVALGLAGATAKVVQEVRIAREVPLHLEEVRRRIRESDPASLLADDHRRLRDLLAQGGHLAYFDEYRDRSIPLLERAYEEDRARPGDPAADAWLLVLLRINSSRSLPFFERTLPAVREPDLRKDIESYLARREGRG